MSSFEELKKMTSTPSSCIRSIDKIVSSREHLDSRMLLPLLPKFPTLSENDPIVNHNQKHAPGSPSVNQPVACHLLLINIAKCRSATSLDISKRALIRSFLAGINCKLSMGHCNRSMDCDRRQRWLCDAAKAQKLFFAPFANFLSLQVHLLWIRLRIW